MLKFNLKERMNLDELNEKINNIDNFHNNKFTL